MVAHSSSVLVFAHLNLSQVPPPLMHVGKWLAALSAATRLACAAPEVDLGECTLNLPLQKKQIRQKPLWLWNLQKTSPESKNFKIYIYINIFQALINFLSSALKSLHLLVSYRRNLKLIHLLVSSATTLRRSLSSQTFLPCVYCGWTAVWKVLIRYCVQICYITKEKIVISMPLPA